MVAAVGLIAAIGVGASAAPVRAEAPVCTIFWTGAQSTAWSVAGNWSLTDGGSPAPHAPTAGDVACTSTTPTRRTAIIGHETAAAVAGIELGGSSGGAPRLMLRGSLTVGGATASASTIAHLQDDGTLASLSGMSIDVSTLTLDGDISGPGAVTVDQRATVDGGTLGADGNGANLTLDGPTAIGDTVSFENGSTVTNDATLSLTGEGTDLETDYSGDQLLNTSKATIDSSTATATTIAVALTNAGTVEDQEGELELTGGNGTDGADTGTVTADARTDIELGGTRTESGAARLDGPGTITLDGDVDLGSSGSLAMITPGTLDLEAIVNVAGDLHTDAGTSIVDADIGGGGTIRFRGSADIESLALGSLSTGERAIFRSSTVTGPVYLTNGSMLANAGAMTLVQGASVHPNMVGDLSGGQLVNQHGADLTSDTSAGFPIDVELPIRDSGRLAIAAGQLAADGGFSAVHQVQIQPGGLLSALSLGLGDGTLLRIAVAPDGSAGEISVAGTAALGGTLQILPDGHPQPGIDDTIVSGAAVSGTFTDVRGLGHDFQLGYSPTAVTLTTPAG